MWMSLGFSCLRFCWCPDSPDLSLLPKFRMLRPLLRTVQLTLLLSSSWGFSDKFELFLVVHQSLILFLFLFKSFLGLLSGPSHFYYSVFYSSSLLCSAVPSSHFSQSIFKPKTYISSPLACLFVSRGLFTFAFISSVFTAALKSLSYNFNIPVSRMLTSSVGCFFIHLVWDCLAAWNDV